MNTATGHWFTRTKVGAFRMKPTTTRRRPIRTTTNTRPVTAGRDVSLDVPPGTLVGIVGPSGAGKTTTVRMLTGAIRPTSGRVRVLGEEPAKFARQTRERIGYMPQLYTLYPDLTARESV